MIHEKVNPLLPAMVRSINRLRRPFDRVKRDRQQVRVSRLISQSGTPRTARSETEFARLQELYPLRTGYEYDPLSTWVRAAERTQTLLCLPGIDRPGIRVLDAGAGEGMLGVLLASFGHQPTLGDMEDWRDPRASELPFIRVNLDDPTTLPEQEFHLICSFNTFEHVANPKAALAGLWRALVPGGLVHLDFGPLFASPWGMHAYHTLHMPYPQYLFCEEFLAEKLSRLGIHDLGSERQELQPMNRWRPSQYCALWQQSDWELIEEYHHCERTHLDLVEEFPEAFTGRGLRLADLVTANLRVTLRKPAEDQG